MCCWSVPYKDSLQRYSIYRLGFIRHSDFGLFSSLGISSFSLTVSGAAALRLPGHHAGVATESARLVRPGLIERHTPPETDRQSEPARRATDRPGQNSRSMLVEASARWTQLTHLARWRTGAAPDVVLRNDGTGRVPDERLRMLRHVKRQFAGVSASTRYDQKRLICIG